MSNYSQKGQPAPNDNKADDKLPTVELGDRLASPAWSEHLKAQSGDPVLASAADMHNSLVTGVSATMRQRENRSPHHTQAQHLDTLAKSYDQFLTRSASSIERQRGKIKSRLDEVNREAQQRLSFKDSNAAELRQVLRSMDDKTRLETINKAAADGDGEVLAAVLNAHPTTSGISHEQRDGIRTQALHTHAPDLLKTEKALKQADELLGNSFNDALLASDSITARDLRTRYAKEQEAAKEAEKQAEAAANGFA